MNIDINTIFSNMVKNLLEHSSLGDPITLKDNCNTEVRYRDEAYDLDRRVLKVGNQVFMVQITQAKYSK